MDFVRRYIAYLQDNPKHYWFKRKLYGWGWEAATKEGWLTLILFIVLIVSNAFRLEALALAQNELALYAVLETWAFVLVLIGICYMTGEPPKWMWGFPKSRKRNRVQT